jgi:hypothetical protein
MENQYYIVSIKHIGSKDNCFEFWCEKSSGYTRAIENAGLYTKDNVEEDFEYQKSMFKIFVHKDIINKLKEKIQLPKYGEHNETYAGYNEFHVLPNTGQIRKLLNITTLDFAIQGNRDSFKAYFKDKYIEKFKDVFSKNEYNVKGKEKHFSEFWYCNSKVVAKNRNQAISNVLDSGDFGLTRIDCNFIEFKKMVTCSRVKTKILHKWKKIK